MHMPDMRSFSPSASPRLLHQCRSQPRRSRALWTDGRRRPAGGHVGIGGENIAENIEGRERYPINVRYPRTFATTSSVGRVVITTPTARRFRSAKSPRFRFHADPR